MKTCRSEKIGPLLRGVRYIGCPLLGGFTIFASYTSVGSKRKSVARQPKKKETKRNKRSFKKVLARVRFSSESSGENDAIEDVEVGENAEMEEDLQIMDDASGDDEVEECAAQICKIGEIDSDEVTWVECDACDDWYHELCEGSPGSAKENETYVCKTFYAYNYL